MDEAFFSELSAWLAQAGLSGTAESDILATVCERCVAAGLPLGRVIVFIDTLHPVHEGRLFRWGYGPGESPVLDYGRTHLDETLISAADPLDARAVENWRRSPFYRMLQSGDSLMRLRIDATTMDEFSLFADLLAAGMTEYVAIINRFAANGVIGDMDGVYTSWTTAAPAGFADGHIAALERIAPHLALAVKSVSLVRMTDTLMRTYLGRDAGRRVLGGRIMRGVAEQMDAVVWFSDLRGFTRITDAVPEAVIPLLNDYADAVISAIVAEGGDVLKLIGDGILAIFPKEAPGHACAAALAAADAARRSVAALNERRAAAGLPTTEFYLGLHAGAMFYGNIGSTTRLDFTIVGPAVNMASRIAAMCRSAEQPLLLSAAFVEAAGPEARPGFVSVGRYALRGVGRPQELFTLDSTR